MKSKAFAVLAATTMVLGIQVAGTQTASAASPCYRDPGNSHHFICQNRYQAPIYSINLYEPYQTMVSRMLSTTSWFICRTDNGDNVGGPHPNRWIWTMGDTYEPGSTDRWGWMKDIDIASETDPLPDCKTIDYWQ